MIELNSNKKLSSTKAVKINVVNDVFVNILTTQGYDIVTLVATAKNNLIAWFLWPGNASLRILARCI